MTVSLSHRLGQSPRRRRVTWLRGRTEKKKKKGGVTAGIGRGGAGGGQSGLAVTLTTQSTGLHTLTELGVDFLRAAWESSHFLFMFHERQAH